MKHWIIVMSPENYEITEEKLRFRFIGLPQRYAKRLSQISIGDKLVYYLTRESVFGAIVTVDGRLFRDDKDIWITDFSVYPLRIPTKLEFHSHNSRAKIKGIVDKLDFIRVKNQWGTFLRSCLKEISEKDFRTIAEAMKNAES